MSFLHALPASLIMVVNVCGTVQLDRDKLWHCDGAVASDPTYLSTITEVGWNLKIKRRNCFLP